MIGGTRNVIAAAREAGVERFVLMSALGTSEATQELVPYWRAKWQMEQDVAASGLEHVILRPSFVFGKDGGVAADLRAPGALLAGRHGARPGHGAARSRSGSTTSPRTSRARSTSPTPPNRTVRARRARTP